MDWRELRKRERRSVGKVWYERVRELVWKDEGKISWEREDRRPKGKDR